MTERLADIALPWQQLVDNVADWSVDLLRRAGGDMADALDRAAMRDVEGAEEWRNLKSKDTRYAG